VRRTRTKRRRRIAHRLSVLSLAVVVINFAATSAWAVDLARKIDFEIRPQRLSTALLEFSHQAKVQIIVGPEVGERTTGGFSGTHSIADALTMLLDDSSLGYRVINDTSITVGSVAALEKQWGREVLPLDTVAPSAAAAAASNDSTTEKLPSSVSSENQKPALEEIVVTGTHIAGVVPVGSAVIVYTRDDVDHSGAATLDQFARTMMDNFSSVDTISNSSSNIRFSPSSTSNGTNTFQGASFNLHGLGPTTTLTLLNGQRLAPGGLDGSFTDISQIPLSVIDHIEVLPDGASAIYGADAVGGVVNIITRKEFDGAETNVRFGGSTEGGAEEITTSQLLGKSWDTGNVLLDYEFDHQDGLQASQRGYIPDLGGPYSLIPGNRRNSVFVSGDQALGTRTTISGDVLFSDRHFSAVNTVDSPPNSLTQNTFASGSARQLNVTAGLDVAMFSDWHAEVTGNYSMSRQTSDAATSGDRGSSPLNTAAIQAASPSIIDINALTQGSLLTLPGGPLKAALGVSYRMEKFGSTDLETARGQSTSIGEPESRRQVYSVYGEVVAPVVLDPDAIPGFRRLDVSVAGRYDHYSDFNSTLNPKLGLSWEVIPGLFLRGTFGTSFQAPLLSQVHAPLAIDTELLPNSASPTGSTDTIIIRGGNLNLLPETSKSYTGGFDLKPAKVPGFTLGVSFFYVNFTSKISTPPTSSGGNYSLNDRLLVPYLIAGPFTPDMTRAYFSSPAFSGDLARLGPSGVQAIFDDQLTNLATTVESGVDLTTQYALSLDPGRLNLSLNVARLLEYNSRTASFAPVVSLLNDFAEPPKWKGRAGAVWTQGPLTASASVNYVSSYQNSLFTPPQSIGAWTTGDLYLSYQMGEALRVSMRKLTVSLSITNVADVHPPRVQIPSSFNLPGERVIPFDPANASPVGRVISVSFNKRW
jgi:iron complex outermembrane receptor protein